MMRLATLLALLAPVPALAFSVALSPEDYLIKWPQDQISYELDANGVSDINDGSDLAAVRSAVSSWNQISCSKLTIVETGTTTSTQTILTENTLDGHNVLVWIEDSRWEYGSMVLGVTTPVFDYQGRIEEADIAFNGTIYWSTDGGYGTDVESVAVHELGHFFGLQHVLEGNDMVDPPTMAPALDPNLRTRTLTDDDEAGACFLYPATSYTCSDNADCPKLIDTDSSGYEYYAGQLTCESGSCSGFEDTVTPTGELGETCSTPNDCGGDLFCVDTGGSGNYCASDCLVTLNDCPIGFKCFELSNSSSGACLPVSVSGGGGGGTDPGGSNPDPGASDPGTEGVCTCDITYDCDASCPCDPECVCLCDITYACDDDCDCDPECGGCRAIAPSPESTALLFVLAAVAALRRR